MFTYITSRHWKKCNKIILNSLNIINKFPTLDLFLKLMYLLLNMAKDFLLKCYFHYIHPSSLPGEVL